MATPPEQPPSVPGDFRDFAEAAPHTPSEIDSEDESPVGSPSPDPSKTLRIPSLRSTPDSQNTPSMTASSTPLGLLQNARRPNPPKPASMKGPQRTSGGALPESVEAKMRAFHLSRQQPSRPQMGGQSISAGSGPMSIQPGMGGSPVAGFPAGFQIPQNAMRPQAHNFVSAPAVPKMGLSARRKMQLPGGLPGGLPGAESSTPNLNLNANGSAQQNKEPDNAFSQFSQYVDTTKGELKFAGKAIINSQGVKFSSGSTFTISLDEIETLDELGKGNYGTVYKVRHSKPKMRRPGLGLAGNKPSSFSPSTSSSDKDSAAEGSQKNGTGIGTGVIMAMKELRLELEEAKFNSIIMELDILHRCLSPYIIDFYGCFFQEGAVYICIEFMDGGSVDKLYGDGVPEGVLRKITYATTKGLRTLKDDHNIIHRDVKPTNILVNTRGQVKICDFGVSGNLVASIAKTSIGCQSYMAPERINGGGMAAAGTPGSGSYSVQSDIWSLGLSIIECAMGRYPYPPETYGSIFSQLNAIVEGEPPNLPEEGYSSVARDFVKRCLHKVPELRPTYAELLLHPWLASLSMPVPISEEDEEMADIDAETSYTGGVGADKVMGGGRGTEDDEVAAWVINAMERKKNGLMTFGEKPALHAPPLDAAASIPGQ